MPPASTLHLPKAAGAWPRWKWSGRWGSTTEHGGKGYREATEREREWERVRVLSKGDVELGQVQDGHVGSNGLASSSAQVSALASHEKGNNPPLKQPTVIIIHDPCAWINGIISDKSVWMYEPNFRCKHPQFFTCASSSWEQFLATVHTVGQGTCPFEAKTSSVSRLSWQDVCESSSVQSTISP